MEDVYVWCAAASMAAQLPHTRVDALKLLKLAKEIWDEFGPGADPLYVVNVLRRRLIAAPSLEAVPSGRPYKSSLV